ncbi:hypothetical protein ACMA1D_19360 [Streptomyces sp. 796.1]|uniref:hypothetical protein n=1 Tax=Streptomyces sp. 796.1 TaxID=3163029 RepID=UPI0039C94DB4
MKWSYRLSRRPALPGPLLASAVTLARNRASWRLVAYFGVLARWSLVPLLGVVLVWGAPFALGPLSTCYARLPSGTTSGRLLAVGNLASRC